MTNSITILAQSDPGTVQQQSIGVDLGTQFAFGGSKFQTIGQLVSQLVPVLFLVSGVVVVFYFLYAAFRYLMSGGNKEETAKARAMITNSLVGFLLLMVIFILARVVPELFGVRGLRIF